MWRAVTQWCTLGRWNLLGTWPCCSCRQHPQTGSKPAVEHRGIKINSPGSLSVFTVCVSQPLSLSLLPCSLLVSNRHHFFDSDLLYQFWINFRRRRRLTELLNENSSRALSESPDSPFCLRKLNPEPGNTSFLSGKWDVFAEGCESKGCIRVSQS